MDLCPTQATKKRTYRIVTIDYDVCIGCAYCVVACPYDARTKVTKPAFAYGTPMQNEAKRFDDARIGVATKCTFCVERIDDGTAKGLTPGVDPDATPACVNSCIAKALTFGDIDDPQSDVSKAVAGNAHFRMHEELRIGPRVYYLYDATREDTPIVEEAM
jgi:phenylacetyl-CoA:acceptor oxidoreductase subunit 1